MKNTEKTKEQFLKEIEKLNKKLNMTNTLKLFVKNQTTYKISISVLFGLAGFYTNFHTLIFPFGEYTAAILLGLLFPMLITLSWGWKYGLLSALLKLPIK